MENGSCLLSSEIQVHLFRQVLDSKSPKVRWRPVDPHASVSDYGRATTAPILVVLSYLKSTSADTTPMDTRNADTRGTLLVLKWFCPERLQIFSLGATLADPKTSLSNVRITRPQKPLNARLALHGRFPCMLTFLFLLICSPR